MKVKNLIHRSYRKILISLISDLLPQIVAKNSRNRSCIPTVISIIFNKNLPLQYVHQMKMSCLILLLITVLRSDDWWFGDFFMQITPKENSPVSTSNRNIQPTIELIVIRIIYTLLWFRWFETFCLEDLPRKKSKLTEAFPRRSWTNQPLPQLMMQQYRDTWDFFAWVAATTTTSTKMWILGYDRSHPGRKTFVQSRCNWM